MSRPPLRELLRQCAAAEGITVELLLSPLREQACVRARTRAAIALRQRGHSYASIGRMLRRHHSSVMYLLAGRASGAQLRLFPHYREASPCAEACAGEVA